MKLISFFLASILTLSAFAAPPMGVSGQQDTSNQYPSVIQTHNKLATNLGSGKTLIESGNTNILTNPSFEHSSWNTAWTVSTVLGVDVVASVETSTVIDGKKAAKVTVTASSFEATNDSTLYAAQYANSVQGLAYARVKTSLSGVKLCARKAGVTSTTLCATHSGSGNWELLKVPFVLSTTSNGISIANYSAQTGTVYIDNTFVGAVDLKVDAAQITTQTSYWTAGSTGTGAVFSGTATTSGSGNYTVSSGIVTALRDINLTMSCSGTSSGSFTIIASITAAGVSGPVDNTVVGVGNTASTSWSGKLSSGQTAFCSNTSGNTASSGFVSVSATNIVNTSIYSQNYYGADRIGEIIFTSNSNAPSGFISALGSSIGQSGSGATFTGDSYYALYEHLWSLAGLSTTAGDPYRISSAKGASALADWQANKTITIDYATNEVFLRAKSSGRVAGSYQADDFKSHVHAYTASNYGAATGTSAIGNNTNAYTRNTEATGGSETRPKNVALFAYVRFQADNMVAVANISGLESCTDTYQCTDTYSAKVSSAGVISDSNISGWLTSCSSTSPYTCTFKTGLFTVAPNCEAQVFTATGSYFSRIESTSSTSVVVRTIDVTTGPGTVNSAFNIICQKQGADFIGKTAKAVASDQNVRSVGSVGVDIQSVYFGSGANCISDCTSGTCSICRQTGTKITSVTWEATGVYRLNGIDGTKYSCNGNGIAASNAGQIVNDLGNSTSTYARMLSRVGGTLTNTAYAKVDCIGIP